MKTIRIKKLCLSYFKGIRQASYDFGENITLVKGCNGSGKSTIVDAISWVLFGVDKNGNTKFGIKSRDNKGNVIQNVTNSVTLTICVDGEDVSFERALRGLAKTDGSVKNEYTYKINGEIQTASDFSKFVDNICPLFVWRMCSIPLSFTSQDWTEQRRMLTSMFGEPDVNTVCGGDKRFDFVVEELKKNNIDKILKHLNYQRKEIQSQLNEVPIRIEELKNVLPQKDEWDDIETQLDEKKTELNNLVKQLHYIEAGQGSSVEATQRRKMLDFAYKRKTEMETGAAIKNNQLTIKYNTDILSLKQDIAKEQESFDALIRKENSYNEIFNKYNERIQELESEKLDGAALWKNLLQRKWKWDNNDSYCQTCGQLLPIDKIEELKVVSEQRFLTQLAKDKKALMEKATHVKAEVSQCEDELEEHKHNRDLTLQQIEETKNKIAELQNKLREIEDTKILSVQDILSGNPSYSEVVKQIEELEKDNISEQNNSVKKDLETSIASLTKDIDKLSCRYNTKAQYNHILAQIDNINLQRKSLQEQLDNIDEKIVNTTTYQRRACEVFENTINGNFKLVRWSMFKRQVDGTDKPWCECSVDGVPFSDLNSAMKINAGIDIINTLRTYYDVDAPCIIDNAETILAPLYNGGQQIRLRVTNDEVIRIENDN